MFSDSFIAEAAQLLGGFDAPISATEHSTTLVRCLNDLVDCWWAAVRDLSLQPQTSSAPSGPIEPNLELVYRMRGTRKQKEPKETKKGKGKAKEKDQPSLEEFNELPIETIPPSAFGLTEEEQLQLAIAESLKLLTPQVDGQSSKPILEAPPIFHIPPQLSGSSSPSDKDMDVIEEEAGAVGSQKSEMEWEATFAGDAPKGEEQLAVEVPQVDAGRQEVDLNEGNVSPFPLHLVDRLTMSIEVGDKSPPPVDAESSTTVRRSKVIGTTRFPFDKNMLDQHLIAALEFWEGRREPRGVDLEESWKCNGCEYSEACEWREAKAVEYMAQAALKSRVRV